MVDALISTTGKATSEQDTMKEMKHMSNKEPVNATRETKCNSLHYGHRKCNEYNHLQMARCVSWEDNGTVSTKMHSVHRTHITEGCQSIEYKSYAK
jgi:hypothetical protein